MDFFFYFYVVLIDYNRVKLYMMDMLDNIDNINVFYDYVIYFKVF